MKFLVLFGSLASVAHAMCDHGTTLNPRDGGSLEPTFSYTGLSGPLNWHGIKSGHKDCALGKGQSPIDIQPASTKRVLGRSLALDIPSHDGGGELENLGTTLEVPVNGSLTLNGGKYGLKQFHFHTPSEHRIDGEHYPMEVHFVFQNDEDKLAVLGFLIEVAGADEKPLELLENVFTKVEDLYAAGSMATTGPLSFKSLAEHLRSSRVYQYGGSLTTPPCAQDVAWNVVEDPIFIDVFTYRKVRHIMKFNSRYSQNSPGEVNLLEHAREILDA